MIDPDIIKEFLAESYENLDRLDRDLIVLEKDPTNGERLAGIFRTIHTIKGACGFLGFAKLEAVAHVGENLLSQLRDGRLLLTAEITSALLALVDAVREMLARIEKTAHDGEDDYATLIARLTELSGREEQNSAAPWAKNEGGIQAEQPPTESPSPHVLQGNIRVAVSLLDKLMTLVGELVLTRNQLLQLAATQRDPTLVNTCHRLNLITSELQEAVMKTRMQPIANVWNKFPRVVRDLALACNKQVRIELEGKETELDKAVLEAIKDPLNHLVRNAVDHGIEAPDVRRARGKAAAGCLLLRAFHEGGQVHIEIADDGGGIDAAKIKEKALERTLISREQAARMSESELLHLIFLPGFSTADKITHVSGRGVGMDVVKTHVEKIGGTVDLQSQPGHGTTIKIKIPLTLAIIPALIVTMDGDRYAIPQFSLLELVRLKEDEARRSIQKIHTTPVYRLRGNLLPLVYLDRELKIGGNRSRPEAGSVTIVVLQADDRQFGLVVDEVNDTEEIVVKPLSKRLKSIPLFAGATIMGDGRVALILDVPGLARCAGVISEVQDRAWADREPLLEEPGDPSRMLLVLRQGKNHQLAIPLDRVTRLEEIPLAAVEKTAWQEVVQYRGQLLPLLRLSALLGCADSDAPALHDPLQVVVCSDQGRRIGLVVDRILDTVEARVEICDSGKRPGILGSAVIGQRVTDLLDLPGIFRESDPNLLEQPSATGVRS